MIASRTFHSELDEATAVERLDELLVEWSAGPDDNRDDATVRIERPTPHRASMWTDADGVEFGVSISLAPSADRTTVTTTIDSFRIRSGILRRSSRLFRTKLLDSFFDEIEQQFAENPPERPGLRTERSRATQVRHDDAARRAARAIDAPGVRAILRRRCQYVIALFVGAVVATTLVPVFTGVAQRRHDHLQRVGEDTTAVVTSFRVGKTTSVDVRFHVDGAEHTYTFDDPEETYRVGDEVAVRVLPDGSFLEIDGEEFDPIASDPAGFSLVAAITLWGSTLFLGRRLFRHRRDLTRHRFVAVPVSAYHLSNNGSLAIIASDCDHRRLLRLAHIIAGWGLHTGWDALVDPGSILTAGPPDRTSVALLPPGRLVHVSRSRNPLRLRWWRRRLRTKGHRVDPR